ncbi:MAG: chemotaxis protein CheC, partial [Candidatus Lokiarchaeota archaeon]|nr:chemotaxis protein CheC [Candidatus Lokiarchaeota archaeon]
MLGYSEEDNFQLTQDQIDALMELGNIGSGNAITALSHLLEKRIDVSLTSGEIIPFWKLSNKLGDSNTEVFGINSIVKGETYLNILQIFTKKSIFNLVDILSEQKKQEKVPIKNLDDFDEYTISLIVEIGNILAGHYTSALADLLSTKYIPDVPFLALDKLGAIINEFLATCSEDLDFILMINTKLKIEDLDFFGILCFIPSVETL